MRIGKIFVLLQIMEKYDLRKFQLRLLEILKAVDKVCRAHELTYYIEAGTLLGAVRHQGFIPWDDDIDIIMPRPDYDRLMAHSEEWLPQPLRMMTGENSAHYHHPFAKVIDGSTRLVERNLPMGLYVDIFPIDGMSGCKLVQKTHVLWFRYVTKKLLYFSCRDPYKHGNGVSSWLPLLCQKIYGYERAQRAIDRMQRKYDYATHDIIIDHDFYGRGIMPKSVLGTPMEIVFEDSRFYAPEHPEEYLARVYGSDYMTPPPPEKRHIHYFSEVEF